MRKRIIAIVIVIAVASAGWWAWVTFGEGSSTDETLGGSGTVEAEELSVSSVIAGRIVDVAAESGAEVTSGTVLFTLDATLLDLQVEQANAGVDAANAALAQVKADDGTKAEIAQAQARIDQAEAARAMADVQASYGEVVAPGSGVVTQVSATVGENAAPGRTLATITDLSRLHVSIYIPETLIGQVRIGDTATVTTDSSDEEFQATVTLIASEAEFTPSNIETKDQRVKLVYEVRLDVTDSSGTLKPGMPVDVAF